MAEALVKDLSVSELMASIRSTVEEAVDEKLEDLQALSSRAYLQSIEEARTDARAGRLTLLEELLDLQPHGRSACQCP